MKSRTKSLKRGALLIALLWMVAMVLHSVTVRPALLRHQHQQRGGTVDAKGGAGKDAKDAKGAFSRLIDKFDFLRVSDYDYENQAADASKTELLNELRYEAHEPHLPEVDCRKIIQGDQEEIARSKLNRLEINSKSFTPKMKEMERFKAELVNRTSNCSDFVRWRKYINRTLSTEEANFPIAYILTIHKKLIEFERLLRAIWRPNNIYCVHVDQKSSRDFHDDVTKLTSCFPNVFMVSEAVDVHYSHYSRVQADLNCLADLDRKRDEVAWRYVINLCGQDFPLKSNYDMVKSLQMLYGANNLETVAMPPHKKIRYSKRFVLPDEGKGGNEYAVMKKTDDDKTQNPLGGDMFAGSAYFIFSWRAINVILRDERVKEFLKWNEDTYSPDEHIWATLQRWHPHLPGSFPPHTKYDRNELLSLTRLVKWAGLDGLDGAGAYPRCQGQYSRGVCVLGAGDLGWVLTQPHLFANKFDMKTDPYSIVCLDRWLRNRTIAQQINRVTSLAVTDSIPRD